MLLAVDLQISDAQVKLCFGLTIGHNLYSTMHRLKLYRVGHLTVTLTKDAQNEVKLLRKKSKIYVM